MSESSTGGSGAISGMLSDDLLEGQHEMTTVLRPERLARPVDVGDSEALLTEITRLCQTWGGAGQPLLPVYDGKMPSPYQRMLEVEQIDGVGGLQDAAVELPFRVEARHLGDYPVLMVAANEPRDQWRPIEICDLDCADPWAPIYAVVFGTLPEVPGRELGEAANLREDLQFDDVVPVRRVQVTSSLDDLAARAKNREAITPRQLANMFLSSGLNPDASFLGEGQKGSRSARRDRISSSWSQRTRSKTWRCYGTCVRRMAIAGCCRLGCPSKKSREKPSSFSMRRAKRRCSGWEADESISSATPRVSRLRELVALSARARTVAYEDILTRGPAPGRPRSHLGTWQEGRTRLVPFSDSDREVLRHTADSLRPVLLVLDVMVVNSRFPADATMRGTDLWGRSQAGVAQVSPSQLNRRETVEVVWPSSWACLAAVAQTRGLDVRAIATWSCHRDLDPGARRHEPHLVAFPPWADRSYLRVGGAERDGLVEETLD
ncbi:hypothetical protein [Amycolatopsis sp. MJM2582]|uniref:hypothetical protein n=1 Tax=Amycolatopsis sp. MJM2582 TaxID=1427749 RepID=UPI001269FE88|nr:hypothetical protein [Amycolatopsis sp. MJM2582]